MPGTSLVVRMCEVKLHPLTRKWHRLCWTYLANVTCTQRRLADSWDEWQSPGMGGRARGWVAKPRDAVEMSHNRTDSVSVNLCGPMLCTSSIKHSVSPPRISQLGLCWAFSVKKVTASACTTSLIDFENTQGNHSCEYLLIALLLWSIHHSYASAGQFCFVMHLLMTVLYLYNWPGKAQLWADAQQSWTGQHLDDFDVWITNATLSRSIHSCACPQTSPQCRDTFLLFPDVSLFMDGMAVLNQIWRFGIRRIVCSQIWSGKMYKQKLLLISPRLLSKALGGWF